MPEISVIIPNYNHTKYLGEAIQSALDQTYKSFEVIIVDDGSTDNCRDVVSEFGNKVRYIWQENQGLAGARNTGIRASKGEFIGLLDADDCWLPSFLQVMVSLASQYPEAAVYYCSAQSIDADGRDLPQVFGGPPRLPEAMYWTLLRGDFLIPSTILMRRSVVLKAGLFDQSLRSCEDWDLWLRILPEHRFIGSSECLVRYRIHSNSLSLNLAGMQQANRAVIEKHFGQDDGNRQSWSKDKHRAYGGVYRYHALSSVQYQEDWQTAALYLGRALLVDPILAEDLDLFYDLALGAQPRGYRGTADQLDLEENASNINTLLESIFGSPRDSQLDLLYNQTRGTAYYALGLVAYNTGRRSLSRHFLLKALNYRHDLLRNNQVLSNLIKTFISRPILERIKGYEKPSRI